MQLGWLREEFRQKVSYISRPISFYRLYLHLGKEHDLALSTTCLVTLVLCTPLTLPQLHVAIYGSRIPCSAPQP